MNPVQRFVLLTLAGLCGVATYFLFAFGGCHSGPGFCAGEPSTTRVFYYVAVVTAALTGLTLARAFTPNPRVVFSVAGGAAALTALAAVVVES